MEYIDSIRRESPIVADILRFLSRQYAYSEWANRKVVETLRTLDPVPAKSRGWMAHIVAAEILWLARLEGKPSDVIVWPDWSITSTLENLENVSERWRQHFVRISTTDLEVQVNYTNSQGQPWSSAAVEIYTHISHHSAYHRGQIAAELSTLGNEPAYTDFIHATRQRLV